MKLPIDIVPMAMLAFLWSSDPAPAQGDCGHPHGDYVVVQVRWEDPIGGLAVRTDPNGNAERRGVIPAAGTGVGISDCLQSGWCQVRYACVFGWSFSARFLSLRSRQQYAVTGVSAADPEGLNLRSGPHHSYAAKGSIPYDARDVVRHVCQPSPIDRTEWCLITYRDESGWVASRFLTPAAASGPAPAPFPSPPRDPAPPSPACQKFPDLC
jgi:uncharacterized protein YraI